MLAWEGRPPHPEDGAREGTGFIAGPVIRATDETFDDAGSAPDEGRNRRRLGVG